MLISLRKHIAYYFFLLLILLLGLILSFYFSFDRQLQMLAIIMTAISYVVWGVSHHFVHHDLTPKIMIEYVLIGSLGMSIVLFIIKGGL